MRRDSRPVHVVGSSYSLNLSRLMLRLQTSFIGSRRALDVAISLLTGDYNYTNGMRGVMSSICSLLPSCFAVRLYLYLFDTLFNCMLQSKIRTLSKAANHTTNRPSPRYSQTTPSANYRQCSYMPTDATSGLSIRRRIQ